MFPTGLDAAGVACVGLGTLVLLGTSDPLLSIAGMVTLLTGAMLLARERRTGGEGDVR